MLDLAFHRPLGSNPVLNLFRIPVSAAQALHLGVPRARYANHLVKMRTRCRFEQQWYDHSRNGLALLAPRIHLRLPKQTDARMKDLLELQQAGWISKHFPSQFAPPQAAITAHKLLTKRLLDFSEGGLAWLDNLVCQDIGVDHGDPTFLEQPARSRFAHSNAAGETK
ncbi:MAG TPA: hypothetical protein VN281_19585 [Verrucomicrobiae bacterium]|nr:hypothetical protein [Verrucomicrobiae bacterium]